MEWTALISQQPWWGFFWDSPTTSTTTRVVYPTSGVRTCTLVDRHDGRTTTKWTADDGPNCRRAGSEFFGLCSHLLHATNCCFYCSRSLLDLAFKTTSTTKHTHTIHLTSKQACALLNASKFVALKSYIAATDCASSQQQQTAARRAAVFGAKCSFFEMHMEKGFDKFTFPEQN